MSLQAQTGLWYDYSKSSSFTALVLTLTTAHGQYLVTALTLLLTLTGSRMWSIIAFAVHQSRAKTEPGFRIKSQVVLRNSSSMLATIWALAKLKSWILVAPLLTWIVFVLAGLFVARIVIPGQVLLLPTNCGFVAVNPNTTLGVSEALGIKNANDSRIAAALADSVDVSFNTSYTTCQFGTRCLSKTLAMDIWLDSGSDLGMNAKDSVRLRMLQTCSVISVQDLANFTADGKDIVVEGYIYPVSRRDSLFAYTIGSVPFFANSSDSAQFPYLQSADVTLHFVSANALLYLNTTSDPLFGANTYSAEYDAYSSDRDFNTLACTEQFQIDDGTTVSPLLGYIQMASAISLSKAPVERVYRALFSARNLVLIQGQGANALQATKLVFLDVSQAVPSNQWEIEVQHWFKTGLIDLQQRIEEYPVNRQYNGRDVFVSPAAQIGGDLLTECYNQRVELAGYINLSFPAIILIVVVCLIILVVSVILEPLVHLRKGIGKLAWRADDHLSLVKMILGDEQAELVVENGEPVYRRVEHVGMMPGKA